MPYGSGSVYKRGRIWWISYMLRGEQVNESSKSKDSPGTERSDATALLKKRMGELAANHAVGSGRLLTVPDLLARLQDNYVEQERRSIADLKGKISALKKTFKGVRASEFGTDDIRRFVAAQKKAKKQNATINRYLAVLRRAFRLAGQHDPPLVGRIPYFALLPENNVRTGFVTDAEYRLLRAELPEHLKGLLIFGYHLGARKSELLNLRRDQVDLPARIIRLERRQTKTNEGRVLPIYGDMVPWLEMQLATWAGSPKCRWIFHLEGQRVGNFRKSWAGACKRAKIPARLFHDLRRTSVRNMERAGIPRATAMAISGHKTEATYRRYNIVAEQDIRAAGQRLEGLHVGDTTAKSTAIEERKQ
jgi:integrase